MEALGGVEPPTNGLGNRCSIHLSYRAGERQAEETTSLCAVRNRERGRSAPAEPAAALFWSFACFFITILTMLVCGYTFR